MPDPTSSPPLHGRRVLVVEDDYVLAEDIRDELEDQGAEVMGPVARVAPALALLSTNSRPDMAVLDINLAGEMVFPVADELLRRGVPFIFLTGYTVATLPEPYAGIAFCEKPVNMQALLEALSS